MAPRGTKEKVIEKAPANPIDETVEEWFRKHFNHVTPGTPDHAVLIAAKADLKAMLAPAAPEQGQAEPQ